MMAKTTLDGFARKLVVSANSVKETQDKALTRAMMDGKTWAERAQRTVVPSGKFKNMGGAPVRMGWKRRSATVAVLGPSGAAAHILEGGTGAHYVGVGRRGRVTSRSIARYRKGFVQRSRKRGVVTSERQVGGKRLKGKGYDHPVLAPVWHPGVSRPAAPFGKAAPLVGERIADRYGREMLAVTLNPFGGM